MIEKTQATIQVGKNGVTKGLLQEIEKQLKKHKTVRIKMLKNLLETKERDEVVEEIKKFTDATVASRKGNVFALRK
jgi:RNA-binding protein YhbY